MAAAVNHLNVSISPSCSRLYSIRNSTLVVQCSLRGFGFGFRLRRKFNVGLSAKASAGRDSVICRLFWQTTENKDAQPQNGGDREQSDAERPPFDLNLAVVLAGFAFEAYTTPPENVGSREMDSSECQTVFLSEHFLREVYDGQILVQLKKGLNLPAMDPWGTSDPYVVMSLGDCMVKSKIIWATKEPHWNETFEINVKDPSQKYLLLAVWDANFVTPHKRMGNGGVKLESLCDGSAHEIHVDLGGIGGGGQILLEIKYRKFDQVKTKKSDWKIPFFSEIVLVDGLASALKSVFGSESVKVRDFVYSAFGKIQPLFNSRLTENSHEYKRQWESEKLPATVNEQTTNSFSMLEAEDRTKNVILEKAQLTDIIVSKKKVSVESKNLSNTVEPFVHQTQERESYTDTGTEHDFWKNLTDTINHAIENIGINKFGLSKIDQFQWNSNDMIRMLGLHSQILAEQEYVGSGLASPKNEDTSNHMHEITDKQVTPSAIMDVKEASEDILTQTESILGSLMMLASSITGHKDTRATINSTATMVESLPSTSNLAYDSSNPETQTVDSEHLQEMKKMFVTAETAMEAWAMLATTLGCSSFIKSEFEKICFLDNETTDTEVAVWRDNSQKRLVVAFRGTEQARWKDLRTDLMLAPAGLNPERVSGDFKEEVQVHSGFLGAYDSVRKRLLSLIRSAVYFRDGQNDESSSWLVYVTGHSLGGALATLLALELSSSKMAKTGYIKVTMYNFGSPRVGNKRFAEEYNKRVKDSWRVVNHRDIIPTVPRLMGYCHVAQPIYLTMAARGRDTLWHLVVDSLPSYQTSFPVKWKGDYLPYRANVEVLEDAYDGVVIGEYTPDILVTGFMKGEKQLIDKLLQTEINLFRAIRDGSALMQHMEDFYYITLLQNVRSRYLE